jgi:DNA-binding transcriptional ArsR family regulator
MDNRKRYTVVEVLRNNFYQLPKFLFEDEFKDLSNDARILYSLLKDRHELSIKNEWYNENGEIYFIMKREEMGTLLNLSAPTVRKALKQLKELNLIDEEHQGLNKPNLIYLMECKNLSVRSETIFQSGVKENYSPECKKFSPINTNSKKTNLNNTDVSIYQEKIENETFEDEPTNDMIDTSTVINIGNEKEATVIDKISEIGSVPEKNIEIQTRQELTEHLCIEEIRNEYPDCHEEINMLFDCVYDVLTADDTLNPTYRISKQKMPSHDVKSAYMKLEKKHIQYVLDSLNKNNNKQNIKINSKSYFMTSLFNAPQTISYYSDKNFNAKQEPELDIDKFYERAIKKSMRLDD